jgi:beta-lactamase class A
MSNLRIHLAYALSIVAAGSFATWYLLHDKVTATAATGTTAVSVVPTTNSSCKLTNQKGYHLIQPLLAANQADEAIELSQTKAKMLSVIDENQKSGLLTSASVYLVSLSDGKWAYINPQESYSPGSMIKVPMLITWLKESEADPSLLNRKIAFSNDPAIPAQTFNSASIKSGNSYTVKDLLHYMVAFSDNNATRLLNNNVVVSDFVKTFTDLNMPEPNVADRNYTISAKHISDFFITLYYATYISKSNSEYAMELLSECDFKEGFMKELPANTKVAHKFGEWGDNRLCIHELHETGVVYLNNKPYLLTVMTKGSNTRDLTGIISRISRIVYDDLSAGNNATARL